MESCNAYSPADLEKPTVTETQPWGPPAALAGVEIRDCNLVKMELKMLLSHFKRWLWIALRQ